MNGNLCPQGAHRLEGNRRRNSHCSTVDGGEQRHVLGVRDEVPVKNFSFQAINSLTFSSELCGCWSGFILLTGSLVTLRTASQQCDSGRDYLSSLPYSTYYYSIYDVKDCLLTSVGLTVSRLHFLLCDISVSCFADVSAFQQSPALLV